MIRKIIKLEILHGAYSAAENAGLGLPMKEEAANADVLGISVGGGWLKQTTEQFGI